VHKPPAAPDIRSSGADGQPVIDSTILIHYEGKSHFAISPAFPKGIGMNHRITVRGFHIDFYGHVNNARYLEFMEEGRWELLKGKIDLEAWHRRGLAFTVVKIAITYRRASSMGDVLEVRTTLKRLERRTGTFEQTIVFAETGETVAEAEVTFVVVDTATGKSIAIAGEVQAILESLA
jgi:thioesterase-3